METKPQKWDSPNLMANQGIAMKNQVLNNYQNVQKKTTTVGNNTTTTKTPTQTVGTQKRDSPNLMANQGIAMKNQVLNNYQKSQGNGGNVGGNEGSGTTTETVQSIKNNQNLGKKLSNASSRFKDMTSSDGIDYKAKYEELINNPDVLCRPDGTPLPIEQQPPQVQEKIEKTEKSIKNVTKPQPTPQPQPEQPVEQEQVVEEQPIEEQSVEQPQEEVQEEERKKPEMNLGENKEGLIYGRASGESQQTIHTNANEYNPEIAINQERQVSYQNLQGMSSYNIAVSMANGYTPFGDQAMRDLQQYDPQKYQEIQDELKKIQVGEQINQIASGGKIDITSQTRAMTDTINNSIDDWAKNNSDSQSYDGTLSLLTSKLASSQTAQSATQEMLNINKDIAEIQTQMNNLPKEAQKAFKGDVPQYLVDAYISNKSQELQTKLNTLQTRYAGLSDMYKAELSQKQFETEMELKNRQFEADQMWKEFDYNYKIQQQNWENNFKMGQFNRQVGQQDRENNFAMQKRGQQYGLDLAQFKLSSIKQDTNGNYIMLDPDTGSYTRVSDGTMNQIIQSERQQAVASLQNAYNTQKQQNMGNGKGSYVYGGQCEKYTNDYLQRIGDQRWGGLDAQGKASKCNTFTPEIGSVAVFDYGIVQSDGKNYGHTMVVTGYDPVSGDIYLQGSNKSNKPGESEGIYTSTVNIRDLGGTLKGFYDPRGKNGGLAKNTEVVDVDMDMENPTYDYYDTPMRDVFVEAYNGANTKDLKDQISYAEDSYAIFNELVKDGYIHKLVNSSTFGQLIQDINNGKFTSGDDVDFSEIQNYCLNKLKDNDLAYAMTRIQRLIEKKLRRESGAAIAQSEWNTNFGMYTKSVAEDPELALKKLQAFERDVIGSNLPTPYRSKIIPLITEDLPTGLEEDDDMIINDNRKSKQETMGRNFQNTIGFMGK